MSQPSEQPWWEQEGLPEAASRFLSSSDCPKGLQASLHDLLCLLRKSEKEKALLEVLSLPSTWTRPSLPALDTALLRGENVEGARALSRALHRGRVASLAYWCGYERRSSAVSFSCVRLRATCSYFCRKKFVGKASFFVQSGDFFVDPQLASGAAPADETTLGGLGRELEGMHAFVRSPSLSLVRAVFMGIFFISLVLYILASVAFVFSSFAAVSTLACAPPSQDIASAQPLNRNLQCFVQNGSLPSSLVLQLSAALNSSGGVIDASVSALAAEVCTPVLASLKALSFPPPPFLLPGLRQAIGIPSSLGELFALDFLFGLVLFPLLFTHLCDKFSASLMQRVHYCPGVTSVLRNFFNTPAHLHMLSYAWYWKKDRAQVLASLLPDCWLDKEALPPGAKLSEATVTHAVHSRCLVVHMSLHYLESPNCMAELIGALLHRWRDEGGSCPLLYVLLDNDTCNAQDSTATSPKAAACAKCAKQVDWAALEAQLQALGVALVCRTMHRFWRRVQCEDLGESPQIVSSALSWFREHGSPKQSALSGTATDQDALRGAIYTQSMRKKHPCTPQQRSLRFRRWWQQGCCCCFFWLWGWGRGSSSPLIRAGALVLAAGEEPAQLSIPQMVRDLWRQLLSAAIALLGISLVLANIYFSPYRGQGSAPFVNFSNAVSGICLCMFVAIAFRAAENLFQTLPHFYYSAYLEPLCAASRLNLELAPQLDSVTVHNPLASHSAPPMITSQSLVNIHFFCAPGGAAAHTLVENLCSFLASGFGFKPIKHITWDASTVEHKVKGEECGIYVFFLQTKEECAAFLDAVHPAPPKSRILADWCAIPVALLPDRERSPAFKEVLFVEGLKKAGESPETEKRILISIARRMAAVLMWGHKLHK
jgi:hypothetical protein